MKPFVTTYTGKFVNPLYVERGDLSIADIAHHLSLINRFNGSTRKPISVAHHSVYVSLVAERHWLWDRDPSRKDRERTDHSRMIGAQGLLHDASEAYLGDVTKWLKESPSFEEYRVAEDRLQRLIFEHYGIEQDILSAVEFADKLMVRYEAKMGFHPDYEIGVPGYSAEINKYELALIGEWNFVTADEAKDMFYKRLMECDVRPELKIDVPF